MKLLKVFSLGLFVLFCIGGARNVDADSQFFKRHALYSDPVEWVSPPAYSMDNPFKWTVGLDKKTYSPGELMSADTSVSFFKTSPIYNLTSPKSLKILLNESIPYNLNTNSWVSVHIVPASSYNGSSTLFTNTSDVSIINPFDTPLLSLLGSKTSACAHLSVGKFTCPDLVTTGGSPLVGVRPIVAPTEPGDYYFAFHTEVDYLEGEYQCSPSGTGSFTINSSGFPVCNGTLGKEIFSTRVTENLFFIPFTVNANPITPEPTITPTTDVFTASDCTIPKGASSCNTNVAWNKPGLSGVTILHTQGTKIGQGETGTATYPIYYIPLVIGSGGNLVPEDNGSTNVVHLAVNGNWSVARAGSLVPKATCESGSIWVNAYKINSTSRIYGDGSCVAGPGPVPEDVTVTIKANGQTNYLLAESGKSVDITWTSTNAKSCTCTYIKDGNSISCGKGESFTGDVRANPYTYTLEESRTFTVNCNN